MTKTWQEMKGRLRADGNQKHTQKRGGVVFSDFSVCVQFKFASCSQRFLFNCGSWFHFRRAAKRMQGCHTVGGGETFIQSASLNGSGHSLPTGIKTRNTPS